MATPQARALLAVRIGLGLFFIFEFITKVGWLEDSGPLTRQLEGWLANAGPYNRSYVQGICLPLAVIWARVVPIAQLLGGLAILLGAWMRPAAIASIAMVLNFHFARGAIFRQSFLNNAYALPVLGGLVALALCGPLPLSLTKK
jgi:uncharacterized membrane protein YphA (DoxX/SURF4 family)